MIRPLALAGLAMALAAAPALAQVETEAGTEAEQLASCIIDHSTEDDIAAMKTVMLYALQDEQDKATAALLKVAFSATSIATGDCGLALAELDSPVFGDAMEIYGEHMGEVIMGRALSFLDGMGE